MSCNVSMAAERAAKQACNTTAQLSGSARSRALSYSFDDDNDWGSSLVSSET